MYMYTYIYIYIYIYIYTYIFSKWEDLEIFIIKLIWLEALPLDLLLNFDIWPIGLSPAEGLKLRVKRL